MLALGIGINTIVFSLANSVFLRQLTIASPQNLVWIFSDRDNPTSYPEYLEYQQQTELFDGVMAYEWVGLNLGSNGQSERTFRSIHIQWSKQLVDVFSPTLLM